MTPDLTKILSVLKGKPKEKFPLRFELEIREQLVRLIEANNEPGKAVKEILSLLGLRLDAQYAFQRDIARRYYNYFEPMQPPPEVEAPAPKDYYIAVRRIDVGWEYLRIYPLRKVMQKVKYAA